MYEISNEMLRNISDNDTYGVNNFLECHLDVKHHEKLCESIKHKFSRSIHISIREHNHKLKMRKFTEYEMMIHMISIVVIDPFFIHNSRTIYEIDIVYLLIQLQLYPM